MEPTHNALDILEHLEAAKFTALEGQDFPPGFPAKLDELIDVIAEHLRKTKRATD